MHAYQTKEYFENRAKRLTANQKENGNIVKKLIRQGRAAENRK